MYFNTIKIPYQVKKVYLQLYNNIFHNICEISTKQGESVENVHTEER